MINKYMSTESLQKAYDLLDKRHLSYNISIIETGFCAVQAYRASRYLIEVGIPKDVVDHSADIFIIKLALILMDRNKVKKILFMIDNKAFW